jgi:hypothetical protein
MMESHMRIGKLATMLSLGVLLASTFLVVSAAAESKVRIVRLSNVEGALPVRSWRRPS